MICGIKSKLWQSLELCTEITSEFSSSSGRLQSLLKRANIHQQGERARATRHRLPHVHVTNSKGKDCQTQ